MAAEEAHRSKFSLVEPSQLWLEDVETKKIRVVLADRGTVLKQTDLYPAGRLLADGTTFASPSAYFIIFLLHSKLFSEAMPQNVVARRPNG